MPPLTTRARSARPYCTDLPRAGLNGAVPLKLKDFVASVGRLAWANANGYAGWKTTTCARVAAGGHLDVLQWARGQGYPWDFLTCTDAAASGHLEVLKWARQHDCPWIAHTCARAAGRGHLAVLKWAREHGRPWDTSTCKSAARFGHLRAAVDAGARLPVG